MKRTVVLMIMLIIAIPLFAQNTQAYIKEMTGTVEIKAPGAADWAPANVGETLRANTMISTGFKSIAVLSIGNTTLVVRALTRMSLDALVRQNESEQVDIGLRAGRIRTEVKPPAGGRTTFTVQSPTATASVRGTEFEMTTMSIDVHEGAVSFAAKDSSGASTRPVMISAGQSSWVNTETGQVVTTADSSDTNIELPPLRGDEEYGGGRLRMTGGEGILSLDVVLR